MRGTDASEWGTLVVERGATPVALDDAAFRTWMARRPVFVSSTMDDEMTADRDAVRAWLTRWGAEAVMWEGITPRDQRAEGAYLDGVDRSDLLILVLGSRYGVADSSGYSPTHKEVNRARDRQIPRLLFTKGGVAERDRAGKLNDWLRELYGEVSGAVYHASDALCALLEHRLREMAASQESLWLKLGSLVFPGRVSHQHGAQGAVYTVTARVRDGAVRRALFGLGDPLGGRRADRLTWTTESQPVTVQSVAMATSRASESEITVTCTQSMQQRNGGGYAGLGGMTFVGGHGERSYGPADQVELWARSAIFGDVPPDPRSRGGYDMVAAFAAHTGPTLPELLRAHQAEGWLAEGLTRLFIVEHLVTKHGGYFDHLDVGPATASGVRVAGRFVPGGGTAAARIAGAVPLR